MWPGQRTWWTAPTMAIIGFAVKVPRLVRIEMGISATPLAGIEGVGQHLTRSIEFIAIAVRAPAKWREKDQRRCPGLVRCSSGITSMAKGEIIFTAYLRTSSCHINSLIQTRQPWPSTLSSVAFHHRRRWMAMDLILGLFIVRLLLSAILCAFVYGTKDSLFYDLPHHLPPVLVSMHPQSPDSQSP